MTRYVVWSLDAVVIMMSVSFIVWLVLNARNYAKNYSAERQVQVQCVKGFLYDSNSIRITLGGHPVRCE